MDWDNRIMFWVKNVPYLWVDNKDWKKCKRVYLVSPQTRAFDKSGRREKLQTFWEERASFYNDISLVENCSDQVSNYFLASIPPAKRRGLKWWTTQPGFPFKHFELRLEGKKFSEEAHFPVLTKLKVVSSNSGKYFTEQASTMSELNLEDLPDEVLSMIAEHSPGLGFGLANKRLAGIWREANDLRRFILKKDKRAADPKFSNRFGKDEIELCLNTGFLYPLQKNLYERWSEKKHTPKSSIIFAQVLGERQEMPRVKMFWLKNSRGEKLGYYVEAPDFKELFGESPPKNRRYLDFADNLKKYISFGLGQSFAKRQKENKKEWLFSSFKGRKIYLDFWFVAGYAFENRGRDIDWDELPKKLKGYFREHDDKLYEQEWEIPLHVLELVDDKKNFKSLSKYLVEREYIPKKKMIKFLKENYNYLSGYERSGLMALFASSEKD